MVGSALRKNRSRSFSFIDATSALETQPDDASERRNKKEQCEKISIFIASVKSPCPAPFRHTIVRSTAHSAHIQSVPVLLTPRLAHLGVSLYAFARTFPPRDAAMAKLVDALDSGSSESNLMRVQVSLAAPCWGKEYGIWNLEFGSGFEPKF